MATPRYLEIREILLKEIASGQPATGARFPTDTELCERFQVSRQTVREALRELQERGILRRRRGVGTQVGSLRDVDTYNQTLNSLTELDAYAGMVTFEKTSEAILTVRPPLAETMNVAIGSKWLRLAGLRHLSRNQKPLGWSEIMIAEPYFAIRDGLKHTSEPYYEQIASQFNLMVTSVEQRISAVTISRELADVLEADAGDPALMVRRRYFAADDSPFEISLSIHPADRYNCTARLVREQRLP